MAEMYAVKGDDLTAIADAIRLKRDIAMPIEIADMAMQIGLIEGGGSEVIHKVIDIDSDLNTGGSPSFTFPEAIGADIVLMLANVAPRTPTVGSRCYKGFVYQFGTHTSWGGNSDNSAWAASNTGLVFYPSTGEFRTITNQYTWLTGTYHLIIFKED